MSDKVQLDVQEDFLRGLQDSGASVSVFLVNGIRLNGQIDACDRYVLQLKNGAVLQMVYKHAISTVLPQVAKESSSVKPT